MDYKYWYILLPKTTNLNGNNENKPNWMGDKESVCVTCKFLATKGMRPMIQLLPSLDRTQHKV